MKKTTKQVAAIRAFLIASTILHFTFLTLHSYAATINQVIVRQQWPWSKDVKVEYSLTGVDASHPVDLTVTAYNGDTPLAIANPHESLKGDLYGITEEFGEFYIDPVAAFGSSRIAMTKFKVKLVVSDSAVNIGEVLYKIYDLTDSSKPVENVTRADLLNGKYGTIETNYTALGSGFTTPLTDVLIWTGVTNDAKYATTHLVMRKIPAKGQTFTMGSPTDEIERSNSYQSKVNGTVVTVTGCETQHDVTLSKDFYMGVFEVTQRQYKEIAGSWPSSYSLEECRDARPVETVTYTDIRGSSLGETWPANDTHEVDSVSFLGKLRTALSGSPKIDIPTEAQWEYACRAKSTTAWYNGYNCPNGAAAFSSATLGAIGRYRMNGGYLNGASIASSARSQLGTTNGTARVGSYMPNAWGLYDMLGNVDEWCLDYHGMFTADADADPKGPARADATPDSNGYCRRVLRGGSFGESACKVRAAYRFAKSSTSTESILGFRLCLTVDE